jgi:chromosome segregation ATPase
MDKNNDLINLVKIAVEEALKAKAGEERTASIELSLEKANEIVAGLKENVEAKAAELAASEEETTDLKARLEELNAKVEELNAQLTKSEEDKELVETRANAAESRLLEIAKESKLKQRLCILEEAKVAKTGEKLDLQLAKVKEFSDEEFDSYKEDLIEMRSSIEEALREEAAKKAESTLDPDAVTVAPANVEKVLSENASILPAVESIPEETMNEKYANLGKAMASEVKVGRN